MADESLGSTTISKSIRSLLDTFASFEKEIAIIFERFDLDTPQSLADITKYLNKLIPRTRDLSWLGDFVSGGFAGGISAGRLAGVLGLADASELAEVRRRLTEFMADVDQLRDREVLLAGGVRDMRAKAARFEEALTGLARVQGRYQARMGVDRQRSLESAQAKFGRLEHAMTALARLQGRSLARIEAGERRSREMGEVATRRDDHITRLIRDTTVQRTQLERMSEELARLAGAAEAPARDEAVESRFEETLGRLEKVEAKVKTLSNSSHARRRGQVEGMESLRERLARIETRAAEISREARAKSGRLDAITRHIASLEGRLASAIGKGGQPVVAAAAGVDNPSGAQQ